MGSSLSEHKPASFPDQLNPASSRAGKKKLDERKDLQLVKIMPFPYDQCSKISVLGDVRGNLHYALRMLHDLGVIEPVTDSKIYGVTSSLKEVRSLITMTTKFSQGEACLVQMGGVKDNHLLSLFRILHEKSGGRVTSIVDSDMLRAVNINKGKNAHQEFPFKAVMKINDTLFTGFPLKVSDFKDSDFEDVNERIMETNSRLIAAEKDDDARRRREKDIAAELGEFVNGFDKIFTRISKKDDAVKRVVAAHRDFPKVKTESGVKLFLMPGYHKVRLTVDFAEEKRSAFLRSEKKKRFSQYMIDISSFWASAFLEFRFKDSRGSFTRALEMPIVCSGGQRFATCSRGVEDQGWSRGF